MGPGGTGTGGQALKSKTSPHTPLTVLGAHVGLLAGLSRPQMAAGLTAERPAGLGEPQMAAGLRWP